MAPSEPFFVSAAVAASPLTPRYAQAVDRRAAYELLAAGLEAAPALERSADVPAYDDAPAGSRRARTDVRFEGRSESLGSRSSRYRTSRRRAGEHVDDDGEVEPAGQGRDVGDVGNRVA